MKSSHPASKIPDFCGSSPVLTSMSICLTRTGTGGQRRRQGLGQFRADQWFQ